jgi:hypothetical protein
MTQPPTNLAATVDGVALPDDQARALWKQFSEHMDQHRGDLDGFAKLQGFTSIAPTYQGGKAVLVAWRNASPPKAAPPPRRPKPGAARPKAKGGRPPRGRK